MIEIVYCCHPENKPSGVLLMGYLNNNFAGTAVASVIGIMLELESIHTDPLSRKNGVASALLHEVRNWGRQMGADYLTGELVVRRDTSTVEEVVSWYRHRGIDVVKGKLVGRL